MYLRARYYNPDFGTFLSPDPVDGMAGNSGSFNPYSYVQGNPVNLTYPSGKFPFLFAGLVLLAGGLTFGGLPAAMEWRVAHDCRCGAPAMRTTNPFELVFQCTAFASGTMAVGGAIIWAAPILALPIAVGGTALSASQTASYWNSTNEWETYKRGEGIFNTLFGLLTLPSAALTTSNSVLNLKLRWLAANDSFFHPDAIYPQIQRGFVGRLAEGFFARLGMYSVVADDSSAFYYAMAREGNAGLLPAPSGPDLFQRSNWIRTRYGAASLKKVLAVADYSIDGEDGWLWTFSGKPPEPVMSVPHPVELLHPMNRYFEVSKEGGIWRYVDAEAKVLEAIGHKFSSRSQGTIWLTVDKAVCPSCSNIINVQWKQKFPDIDIILNRK